MPRAKPSSWRPKGIEVNTHDLYSDDDLAKLIIHHTGTHSNKNLDKSGSNCATLPGYCGRSCITERGRLAVKKKKA
jgi:hypothetical protein